MKVRESCMPGENLWENFFEPEQILETMKLDYNVVNMADFGFGHGTFTIPAQR